MAKRKQKRFGKLPYSVAANNLPQAFEANERLREKVAAGRRRRGQFPDANGYIPVTEERDER